MPVNWLTGSKYLRGQLDHFEKIFHSFKKFNFSIKRIQTTQEKNGNKFLNQNITEYRLYQIAKDERFSY